MGCPRSSSLPKESPQSGRRQGRVLETHGAGFGATLWGSRNAQVTRFDVMIDMTTFAECRVLDVGCGPGDFAAHLVADDMAVAKRLSLVIEIAVDEAELINGEADQAKPKCRRPVHIICPN